jgi:CAAX prenyl protease-like protein
MKQEKTPLPWSYYAPHFAPLVVYFLVRSCAGILPFEHATYWAYLLTIPAVAGTLLFFRREYTELEWKKMRLADLGLAVGVGLAGIVVWILPYHFAAETMQQLNLSNLLQKIGLSSGSVDQWMDPTILDGWFRVVFVVGRIAGAVILIPFAEELFHRSGVMRLIIRSDFREEPIGRYTPASFAIGLAIFALSHEEWIVAAVWGAMICALLYRTRRLETCIVAHAVSNLVLAGYVLQQGAWHLW